MPRLRYYNAEKARLYRLNNLEKWREYHRNYAKQWRSEHPVNVTASRQKSLLALREKVIKAYGGKCACCGEAEYEFLALDHVNGDGAEQRRLLGQRGSQSTYRWAIKNEFPDTLQLLCHNCNLAKGFYGACPHAR